ncbi:hypothetical protein R3P38DRAFT_2758884 [Favolaschia claudopus]|uniref:Uncharacterized protein n=1 Tax=Favolaschia claudopus TaxID=2862362 RepID=A0AAW0E890_9AGAR
MGSTVQQYQVDCDIRSTPIMKAATTSQMKSEMRASAVFETRLRIERGQEDGRGAPQSVVLHKIPEIQGPPAKTLQTLCWSSLSVECRDVATIPSSTTISDAGDDHRALPMAQLLVVSSVLKCFTKLLKHSRPLFWWTKILCAERSRLLLVDTIWTILSMQITERRLRFSQAGFAFILQDFLLSSCDALVTDWEIPSAVKLLLNIWAARTGSTHSTGIRGSTERRSRLLVILCLSISANRGFDNSLRLQDSSCADHRPLHKASGGPEDSWDGGHRLKELRRCWKDFRMDENITLHALPRSSSLSAFKILVQPVTLDVSSGSVLKLRKGYGDNYDNSVAHVGMLALEDFAAASQQLKRGLDIRSGVVRVNTTRLLPSMEASHAPPERPFPSRMQSGLAFSGVPGAFPNKCSLRSFVNVRAYSNIAPAGDSSARWGASPRRAIVQSSLNHTTNVGRNRRSWAEACPPLPDSGDREETGAGASDSNTERRSRLLVAISSKVMQMGKGTLHLGMRGCEFGIQNFLSSSLSLGGEGYV